MTRKSTTKTAPATATAEKPPSNGKSHGGKADAKARPGERPVRLFLPNDLFVRFSAQASALAIPRAEYAQRIIREVVEASPVNVTGLGEKKS